MREVYSATRTNLKSTGNDIQVLTSGNLKNDFEGQFRHFIRKCQKAYRSNDTIFNKDG